ncbi:hypothetical protein [Nemorincola caseinilytica]
MALKYQADHMYLIDKAYFINPKDERRYLIRAIIILPSDRELFESMADLIVQYYLGHAQIGQLRAMSESYNKDEFTVVLFGRTDSLSDPVVAYAALSQLVTDTGELTVGFPFPLSER